MNKKICWTAFFIGLFAVGWVGVGYIGGSPLALAMTVIVGLVYLAGALELRRFAAATDSLAKALAAIPDNLPSLDNWLAGVDPSLLHNAHTIRAEPLVPVTRQETTDAGTVRQTGTPAPIPSRLVVKFNFTAPQPSQPAQP